MGKTTLGIDAVQILIRGNKFANKDIVTHGKLEYIYSRIDEKILENEPITKEQHQEAEWESNTNR